MNKLKVNKYDLVESTIIWNVYWGHFVPFQLIPVKYFPRHEGSVKWDKISGNAVFCAFSNVSSNCPRQWMHNHTGCNDSAFLRCGFSYVSSMWLPERKLYRTGCTFLTFQSLDPSLVQISKREERDNCSIWTRLMYICNWPLVLSYSKLKEWKWNLVWFTTTGYDPKTLLEVV